MTGKAKRRREKERKHMNEAMQAEMEEKGFVEVWECSGTKEHRIQCNNDECKMIPLTQLDLDINEEVENWDKAGMATVGVRSDTFRMDCRVHAIVDFLEQVLEADMEVLNKLFRERLLKELRLFREQHEEEIRAARLAQSRGPALVDPSGKTILQ